MRKYIRHNSGIPINIIHEDNQYKFVLLNVSLGGIACKGNRKLDVHTEVQVHIPPLRPEYTASGRVVWCNEIQDSSGYECYEIGIEHCGEKNMSQLRMVEQISNIEHYRSEVKNTEGRTLTGEEAAREWVSIYASD